MINKRGISPLIATVLIIGFTIVIAAIVITFGTNIVKTATENTERQAAFSMACNGVSLDVKTSYIPNNGINVIVQNENAQVLEGLVIVMKSTTGQSKVYSSDSLVVDGSQQIPPISGQTFNMGPFSAVALSLNDDSITDYSLGDIEVRAIVESNGEKQVCTTPSKAKIPVITR